MSSEGVLDTSHSFKPTLNQVCHLESGFKIEKLNFANLSCKKQVSDC